MIRVFVATLALVCAGSVHAAEPYSVRIGVANWSGAYLGGTLGYAWAKTDGQFDSSEVLPGEDGPLSIAFLRDLNIRGLIGGAYAGYNWHIATPWIVGAELDWMHFGKSDTVLDANIEPQWTDQANGRVEWVTSLRARFGYAMGDTMLFATVGPAWVQGRVDLCACDLQPNINIRGSAKLNHIGVVAGGGLEHRFRGTAWSARVEFLHYSFNEMVDLNRLTVDSDPGDFAAIKNIFVIRAGAAIHF